jgi:hypothetical protein
MYPLLAGVFGAIAVDYYCFRRPMFKAFEDYNKAYREDCERRLRDDIKEDLERRLRDEEEMKRRYGK